MRMPHGVHGGREPVTDYSILTVHKEGVGGY